MRPTRFIALLVFLAASGCYRYVGHPITHPHSVAQPALRRNVRTFVVMSDGVRRPFRDAVILGDSLYGWSQESGAPRSDAVIIALDHIERIDQQKADRLGAAVILVAGITLSVIGAIKLAASLHKKDPWDPF